MYVPTCNSDTVLQALQDLNYHKEDNQTLLLLVAVESAETLHTLINELQQQQISFFGAVFPQLVNGNTIHNKGVIIKILPLLTAPILISLKTDKSLNTSLLASTFEQVAKPTALLLAHGEAFDIANGLAKLFYELGNTVQYVGVQTALEGGKIIGVFTETGMLQDTMLAAFLPQKANVKAQHTWKILAGPFIATKTRQNLIRELNWKNAFEVYSVVVSQQTERPLLPFKIEKTSIQFPLGIYESEQELKVRKVIDVTERMELKCGGNIPEHSILYVLRFDKERLKEAIQQIVMDCCKEMEGKKQHFFTILSVDSHLFHTVEEEVNLLKTTIAQHKMELELQGVVSIGQIATCQNGFPTLLNQSIVGLSF